MRELIPDDVYRELVETGEDWADKKAAYDVKDGLIKSVKAEQFLKFKGSCTVGEAEQRAYDSEEYRTAVADAAEAGRLANRARIRYDATRALFDARRTAEATHRAAMGSAA